MEKPRWRKARAALGIAWNTGKIKTQELFLSSCSFLSSEWVVSRICWNWFLALRHLPCNQQKEQTIAGNIFSREQKHRPGSQGRNLLRGTEHIVLWEKIAPVAICQNCVGFFPLMLLKIKTISFIKHAADSSHGVAFVEHIKSTSGVIWCGFSFSVMCISSKCLNILCWLRSKLWGLMVSCC